MADQLRHALSESENERIFQRRVLPRVLADAGDLRSVVQPELIMVGGQPGAGKSKSILATKDALGSQGGVLAIDIDALREFHPEQDRLMALDDRTAANYTHADASLWARKLEKYAQEHRYNVLLESTMKTPDNVATKLEEYRAAGYATEVKIVAVHERSSWLGVLSRYESQKDNDGFGRMVPKQIHDGAYEGLLDSAERVERDKLADRVGVYDRAGSAIR